VEGPASLEPPERLGGGDGSTARRSRHRLVREEALSHSSASGHEHVDGRRRWGIAVPDKTCQLEGAWSAGCQAFHVAEAPSLAGTTLIDLPGLGEEIDVKAAAGSARDEVSAFVTGVQHGAGQWIAALPCAIS
jgi:hypothetical protein